MEKKTQCTFSTKVKISLFTVNRGRLNYEWQAYSLFFQETILYFRPRCVLLAVSLLHRLVLLGNNFSLSQT